MNIGILTSCYGYDIDQVKPWVNSLKKTGFGGKVFVIVYNPTDEKLLEYFKSAGIFVFTGVLSDEVNMATQRFGDYEQVLKTEYGADVEAIITTDIRDVIFQKDPGVWFQNNIQDYDLMATSEGITFRHEDWNGGNLERHFGKTRFLKLADKETLCSGIIAGRRDMMIKLFRSIQGISYFSENPMDFVDQIFYNIAIYEIFFEKTRIIPATQNWVANLGTLKAIPENSPQWSTGKRCEIGDYERIRNNKTYVEAMKCKVPEMKGDILYADNGNPFTIVHQYDRFESWKIMLTEKYSK